LGAAVQASPPSRRAPPSRHTSRLARPPDTPRAGKAAQNVIIKIAHDTEGWSEEQWEAARTDLVDSSARCNEKDFPGKRNPAGGQAQTKTCWVRPDKVIGLTNSDVRKAAELLAGQGI